MAISEKAIIDVRSGGSDAAAGGFFNPFNANFATDLTTDANTANTASPVVSSASYTFVAGDVNAYLFIKAGTNWLPGWYLIASVSGGKATLSAAIAAGILASTGTGTFFRPTGPTTVVGVATVGTPTAGTFGIDYSQQNAAQISFTDMVVGATTTQFTSALNPVGKNMIGNYVRTVSGAGVTLGHFEIVSTSGITATCDRSLGTAASVAVGSLGGALATQGYAASVKVGGNVVFVKAATYTLTTASPNISGGIVQDASGAGATGMYGGWIGWNTVRSINNTDSTQPIFKIPDAGVSSVTIFSLTGANEQARNLTADGNNKTAIIGFSGTATSQMYMRCKAMNCTSYGLRMTGNTAYLSRCSATACSGTAGISTNLTAQLSRCEAYANTTIGIEASGGLIVTWLYCLSYNNTGGSSSGFRAACSTLTITHCSSYGNGSHGFNIDYTFVSQGLVINSWAYSNGGFGWYNGGVTSLPADSLNLVSCAGGNNTSGNQSVQFIVQAGFIALTADPTVNGAAGNVALNNVAGGGAALRSAGLGTWPGGTTTGYPDIGAAQHQDAGGILYNPGMSGGMAG